MIDPQEQLEILLTEMRQYFRELSQSRWDLLVWSKADIDAYTEAIKATVDGKSEVDDGVCFWWAWLRDQVTELHIRREVGAQTMARIKASIEAKRLTKKAA